MASLQTNNPLLGNSVIASGTNTGENIIGHKWKCSRDKIIKNWSHKGMCPYSRKRLSQSILSYTKNVLCTGDSKF